jgi:hypothetical protein
VRVDENLHMSVIVAVYPSSVVRPSVHLGVVTLMNIKREFHQLQ